MQQTRIISHVCSDYLDAAAVSVRCDLCDDSIGLTDHEDAARFFTRISLNSGDEDRSNLKGVKMGLRYLEETGWALEDVEDGMGCGVEVLWDGIEDTVDCASDGGAPAVNGCTA